MSDRQVINNADEEPAIQQRERREAEEAVGVLAKVRVAFSNWEKFGSMVVAPSFLIAIIAALLFLVVMKPPLWWCDHNFIVLFFFNALLASVTFAFDTITNLSERIKSVWSRIAMIILVSTIIAMILGGVAFNACRLTSVSFPQPPTSMPTTPTLTTTTTLVSTTTFTTSGTCVQPTAITITETLSCDKQHPTPNLSHRKRPVSHEKDSSEDAENGDLTEQDTDQVYHYPHHKDKTPYEDDEQSDNSPLQNYLEDRARRVALMDRFHPLFFAADF